MNTRTKEINFPWKERRIRENKGRKGFTSTVVLIKEKDLKRTEEDIRLRDLPFELVWRAAALSVWFLIVDENEPEDLSSFHPRFATHPYSRRENKELCQSIFTAASIPAR